MPSTTSKNVHTRRSRRLGLNSDPHQEDFRDFLTWTRRRESDYLFGTYLFLLTGATGLTVARNPTGATTATTGIEQTLVGVGLVVFVALVVVIGRTTFVTLADRVGDPERNLGLATRALLLSLKQTDLNNYRRRSIFRSLVNFRKAARRAGVRDSTTDKFVGSIQKRVQKAPHALAIRFLSAGHTDSVSLQKARHLVVQFGVEDYLSGRVLDADRLTKARPEFRHEKLIPWLTTAGALLGVIAVVLQLVSRTSGP